MENYSWVTENLLPIFASYGIGVAGLTAFLGKVLVGRIVAHDTAILEQKIETLKNKHKSDFAIFEYKLKYELAKSDQFHQISKPTFEKIFDKKVGIYTQLLELSTQFKKFHNENYTNEILDPSVEYSRHFGGFRTILEENRLYISNELVQSYDLWYSKAAPHFKKLDKVYFNSSFNQESRHPTSDDLDDLQFEKLPHVQNLVENTIEEIHGVVEQIERDVALFQASISSINTPL